MNNLNLRSILNWNVSVGKLFGIRIRLHVTILFFIIPALANRGLNLLVGIEFALAVILSILIHELGHALTAKAFHQKDLEIMLHGFGGFASSQGDRTPKQELLIVFAGPLADFIFGEALLLLSGHMLNGSPLSMQAEQQWLLVSAVGTLNLWLGALNLIPCLPWDGGLIVTALLWYRMNYTKALRITAHLSLVLGPILFIYGFAKGSSFFELFGGVAAFSSYMILRNTGGIRFGEALADHRTRKEEIAFQKRQKEKRDVYIGDVIERQLEREEKERLRKLLE
jgi:Zn-dependent protease